MTAAARTKPRYVEPVKTGFRFRDFLVILLCLFIIGYFLNLFRLDLFQTINLQNVEPVGTITIKNNTVQRRIADRVLWDRLVIESPVYLGDLIRVAEMSSAVLNIDGQQLDIGENTLIRIQLAPNGEGLQIELSEGSIGITVTEDSVNHGYTPLQLNMNGRVVETTAGTSITASASDKGTQVQVNEGAVTFIEGTTSREITSGEQLALDNTGTEVLLPSVVVTHPLPNARYVKTTQQSVPIAFSWNRINLQPQELIRLEIAADRYFSRNVIAFNDLNTSLETTLEAGNWNWRFILQDTVLSTGRLTVIEASVLDLQSPARGSLFRYDTEPPAVRFQWSEVEEVSHYIIEISSTSNFENHTTRQTSAPFYVDASLGSGTWYWRVKPVFASSYTGSTEFSRISFFITEQSEAIKQANEVTLLASVQTAEIEQEISQASVPEIVPEPQIIVVEPEPPFAVPANRTPVNGQVYGIEQLRTQRSIVFNWTPVQGANAYIVTLLQQTASGRRVINNVTVTSARWVLDDISVLSGGGGTRRGTYIWQVEAITRNADGTINRRGGIGENSFTMDIPSPNPVRADSPGVLYGY